MLARLPGLFRSRLSPQPASHRPIPAPHAPPPALADLAGPFLGDPHAVVTDEATLDDASFELDLLRQAVADRIRYCLQHGHRCDDDEQLEHIRSQARVLLRAINAYEFGPQ